MKKIGVLVPSFTIEYCYELLEGICNYLKDKEVQVIIAQTKYPHGKNTLFDYQYWSSVEYLKSKEVSAIIVFSGIFCSTIEKENLKKIIEDFKDKHIISIAVDLGLKKSHTIISDCSKAYDQIVDHLIKKHGCKRIAFMSASNTGSPEAIDRENCFLNSLKKHKIKFYKEDLFQGNFTSRHAISSIKSIIKKPEDVKFDSLIAANDDMAFGVIKYFNQIGIRVPDDVKVIGYDDSVTSAISSPTISTINQQIYQQGILAAECVFKLVNNQKVPKTIYSDLSPKFKQSCGCIDLGEYQKIYKDLDDKINPDANSKYSGVTYFLNEMSEKNRIVILMDIVKGANTIKQFYYNIRYIVDQCYMDNICISFFDEAMYLDSSENFILPDKQEVTIFCDRTNGIELFKPDIVFDPHKVIIPTRTLSNTPGIYILQPIFAGDAVYGSMLCGVKETKFADYNIYLKILSTSLSQNYEYTSKIMEAEKLVNENTILQQDNSNLNIKYKTDELTNVFNRRGFIEVGQRSLDLMQEMDNSGLIFFADIDGLKKINDNYGHDMGDRAIQLQAEVLKSAFRSTDVVGRLSGDEFGIVAVGMKISDVDKIKLKIKLLNEKISRINNLPFTLSISIGVVDLQKSSVLKNLLTEANKDLYREKKIKKERLK